MSLIRMHQEHTLTTHRKAVDDAASIVGEMVFALAMYSSLRPASKRCSICYDDVYGNTTTSSIDGTICPSCFGTTYANGVKTINFTKATIGRAKHQQAMDGSKGQSEMMSSRCSILWPSDLNNKDYIIRVLSWEENSDSIIHAKDIDVFKVVSSPVNTFLKDGLNPTGTSSSLMGQAFDIVRQAPDHPLRSVIWPGMPRKAIVSKQPFIYVPDWELESI